MNPTADDGQDTWAWDQYWRDGRLASCGGAGGANYQPAITAGWMRFFETLPAGSRILDACTGNGAIARLAAESAVRRAIRFNVDAFDSAQIVPAVPGSPPFPGRDMIRFHSRIAAESLPFPSALYNVVTSQYGIEYTALETSLAELARVSKAGARIRFVMHAAEGIVVTAARSELKDVEWLHRGCDVFDAAAHLANVREQGAPEAVQQAAAERFRRALESVERAASAAKDASMHRNVAGVLTHALSQQPRAGTSAVLAKIDEVAATVAAHGARLTAMIRAALDEEGIRALSKQVSILWQQHTRPGTVTRPDGALLGWVLENQDNGQRAATAGTWLGGVKAV